MIAYSGLWALLVIAGVAVAVTEWRGRAAVATASTALPSAAGYRVRSAVALSRIDTLRIVGNPLVWLGGGGSALLVWQALESEITENMFGPVGLRLLGVFIPVLLGFFIAVHVTVSRDRRTGMDELAATLPVGIRTRTLGHLTSLAWIVVPLAVASVGAVLALLGPDRTVEGVHPPTPWTTSPDWTATAVELAQTPLAVTVLLALAVATGTWWRHPAVAILVPVILFLSPLAWAVPLTTHAGPRAEWGTLEPLGVMTTTHLAWHLVFLVGYLVVAVAGALIRHDRRLAVVTAAVVGLVTMIVSFMVKVPGVAWL